MLGRLAAAVAVTAASLGLVGPPAAAEPADGLTAVEHARLDRGELVSRRRAVAGYPWPEVTVYARVQAGPVEVMAVYADFDNQFRILPEMVHSRVVGRAGSAAWQVFYEYEVAGPNERYTVTVRVSRVAGAYHATWDLITARYARRLEGEMHVAERGDGSLVRYASRVDPGVLGTTLGSPESVERRLRATVEALARHVERLRAERPDALTALVRTLRLAVKEGRAESRP